MNASVKTSILAAHLFCVLYARALSADGAESSSLSSASADYNGSTLILKGKVVLDHGLGKMTSEEASLERQETGKDFPFSLIHLQKDVLVKLPNQAELRCDAADLDFTVLKGLLLAKGKAKVSYTAAAQHKVRVMSNRIDMEIEKIGHDGKKTAYIPKSILATGDVIIDYAKGFTLRADHALYRKESDKSQETITAYPKDADSHCLLTHEGDRIDAELVHFDLNSTLISLQRPKGTLFSSLVPHVHKSEIAFDADRLLWDHEKNRLSLKGNIHLTEASLGSIEADDLLELTQAKSDKKRLLQTIRARGKTLFHYRDATTNTTHELLTYGPFLLDREQLRVTIESPESDGSVLPEHQIYYKEAEIAVYADRATIEYTLVNNVLQPVSLALKGNVRLFSHDPQQPALCGVSDRITFSPSTRTLILSADPHRRVLFWDDNQGMRLSSQEIHITQDSESKQRTIKGIGNVKFAFTAEEQSMLHDLFPLYKVVQ
jgi:lipopolysaccharide export system protein LptA